MSVVRQKQTSELVPLREVMTRMFDSSFLPGEWFFTRESDGEMTPLDMYEEKDKLVVKASVPAVKPEDISVQVKGNLLTISGETKEETEAREATFYRHERRYGRFERAVTLPYEVPADKVDAVCKDGILTLTMPKQVKTEPKETKIKVRS